MSESGEPFRLLSYESFAKLTRHEKIAYLAAAIDAIVRNTPIVGVIRPAKRDAEMVSKPS